MTITPQIRFCVQRSLNALGHGSRAKITLRHATYWESFPHSYTEDQVAAAQELMIAWFEWVDGTNVGEQHVKRVLAATDRVSELIDTEKTWTSR